MVIMKTILPGSGLPARALVASLAVIASCVVFAQTTAQERATLGAAAPVESAIATWAFGTPVPGTGGWTAERGTLSMANGSARMQPDANRRIVLLSPPALPGSVKGAEEFMLGIEGTGLQRVRVQARRDARGGWITIADASGSALRESADGYTVKRKAGARDASIERLRIELQFRTTNPRVLTRIAAR
jgi:hypothetical protein